MQSVSSSRKKEKEIERKTEKKKEKRVKKTHANKLQCSTMVERLHKLSAGFDICIVCIVHAKWSSYVT